MKTIIKTIKCNREELISKHSKMMKEIKVLSEGIKQARKMEKEDIAGKLWNKRSELNTEVTNINMAINDLTNALNLLGESTEIYWG